MRPMNLVFGIALGTLLAAGIWVSMSVFNAPEPRPTIATILPVHAEVPSFSLLDQRGETINEDVFKGQWDLVFFGFTHCPDVCPITLNILNAAKERLRQAGEAPLPRIVLVSVDPERDTPDKMSDYVKNFGDDNLGITGDVGEIRKLTDSLGIFFEKRGTDNESYTVDHSAVVIVIDPDGRFRALFGSPHTIENYVHDLPLIVKS